MPTAPKKLTDGQRAYKEKGAARAGMSLDKWRAAKERGAAQAARAKVAEQKPAKPPGFFKRLLDRAHKPL